MSTHYSISIPKPCHEDWSKMTPNEKGRFCKSCTKTVVDFTKMSPDAIQHYLHNNKDQRICGHIKQSQLDSINLRIPEAIIHQNQSFHRLFLLALLISMGMTLFSCEDENGQKKKIESIKVVETKTKVKDSIIDEPKKELIKKDDSIVIQSPKKTRTIPKPDLLGLVIVETGEVAIHTTNSDGLDSLNIKKPKECTLPTKKDSIVEPIIMGDIMVEEEIDDTIVGFIVVNQPPEFSETPKQLTTKEKKVYFSNRIQEIVKENFKTPQSFLDLHGKQRIFTQFTINEIGEVENIKVRASHPLFEAEAKRVVNLFPKFKPGKQRGKAISVVYNLPITFVIDD
ncbi:energy transducer TonB [Winogradskyella algicola]|uniref:energy transducer TonB n=1 Tax=Winogradskyella algicola TaxID=2575815 RepID=UPI00110901E5|nr:energy transducer TonB [Winogradskyella algicola]